MANKTNKASGAPKRYVRQPTGGKTINFPSPRLEPAPPIKVPKPYVPLPWVSPGSPGVGKQYHALPMPPRTRAAGLPVLRSKKSKPYFKPKARKKRK